MEPRTDACLQIDRILPERDRGVRVCRAGRVALEPSGSPDARRVEGPGVSATGSDRRRPRAPSQRMTALRQSTYRTGSTLRTAGGIEFASP